MPQRYWRFSFILETQRGPKGTGVNSKPDDFLPHRHSFVVNRARRRPENSIGGSLPVFFLLALHASQETLPVPDCHCLGPRLPCPIAAQTKKMTKAVKAEKIVASFLSKLATVSKVGDLLGTNSNRRSRQQVNVHLTRHLIEPISICQIELPYHSGCHTTVRPPHFCSR